MNEFKNDMMTFYETSLVLNVLHKIPVEKYPMLARMLNYSSK